MATNHHHWGLNFGSPATPKKLSLWMICKESVYIGCLLDHSCIQTFWFFSKHVHFCSKPLNYHLRLSMAYPTFLRISQTKLHTPQPSPSRECEILFSSSLLRFNKPPLFNLFLWKLQTAGCRLVTPAPLTSPVFPSGTQGRKISHLREQQFSGLCTP